MKQNALFLLKWKKHLIKTFVFVFLLIVCIGAAACVRETVRILGTERFIEIFLFNLFIQFLYRFSKYYKR